MPQVEWSNLQIDEFLELVLPCDSTQEYQRALVSFAKLYQRDANTGLDEGDQLLRRRSNRRSDYSGPATSTSRMSRSTLPWTWVENRILDWAVQKNNSESRREVTDEYLANLLQRSVQEVSEELERRKTEKHGIKGFDL